MFRVALPLRQLARASHRVGLVSKQCERFAAHTATRGLTTLKPMVDKDATDSNVHLELYTRIAKKMSGLLVNNNVVVKDVEEKIASAVAYLQTRFNISEGRAIRTIALHPMVATYTVETMERKIQWLLGAGLDMEMVKIAVQRHPMILGRSEESLEAAKGWIIARGVDPSKIPFIFTCCPHIVSFSAANKDSKVETLRVLGLNDDHIRRVLQRFPQILQRSNDQMVAKVEVSKAMGFSEDAVVRLITLVPEFLGLSMDQVKLKVEAFEEMFGPGRGMEVWALYPRLIMCKQKELRRSYDFLTQVAGVESDRIAANISIIMRSVDRVLQPRYEFLKSCDSSELKLKRVRWIGLSDIKFHERYPEFRAFLDEEYTPANRP